jgi:polygalacturonase
MALTKVTFSMIDGAAINVKDYGAKGNGTDDDTVALQTCLNLAAVNGNDVYLPAGTYKTTAPLVLQWTATPASGLPARPKIGAIFGDGDSSVIQGTIATAGRAVLELLGESNPYAVNTQVRDLTLRMSGGSGAAYCLRVGDAKESFGAYRVKCLGANGVLLKVGSTSWAQMNTLFVQCSFRSNYDAEWYPEASAEVYAVNYESGGARWDNVNFVSCLFGGLVETRASICAFDNCQFITSAERPTTSRNFANNVNVRIGNASFSNCYFEDHDTAIEINPTIDSIQQVTIDSCRFSGINNTPGTLSQYGIVVTGTDYVGIVEVRNCYFGDVDASGSRLYEQASIRCANGNATIKISGAINYYKPDTPIKVELVAANFQMQNQANDAGFRIERVLFSRTGVGGTGNSVLYQHGMANVFYRNISQEYCWVNCLRVAINSTISSGTFNIVLLKNGSTVLTISSANFTSVSDVLLPDGENMYKLKPSASLVYARGDNFSCRIDTSSISPAPIDVVLEVDFAY